MKENYTHVVMIVDRSGSMESVRSDTIGGINTFVQKQKEVPGDITFTLVQFNTEVETIVKATPVKEIGTFTEKDFVPDGGTALYDAIGKAVNAAGVYFSGLEDSCKPSKVVVLIVS